MSSRDQRPKLNRPKGRGQTPAHNVHSSVVFCALRVLYRTADTLDSKGKFAWPLLVGFFLYSEIVNGCKTACLTSPSLPPLLSPPLPFPPLLSPQTNIQTSTQTFWVCRLNELMEKVLAEVPIEAATVTSGGDGDKEAVDETVESPVGEEAKKSSV